jgi:hypothetical protein
VPLVLWLVGWGIDRARKANLSFADYLNRFAIALVPLAAAGHVCKAILKTTSRLKHIPDAFRDPIGIQTASAIVEGKVKLQTPGFVAAGWPVTVLLLASLAVGLGVSIAALVALRRREGRFPLGTTGIACLYWTVLTGTIVIWRVI